MFEPLPARFSFPESELRILEYWQKLDVFGKSLEIRQGAPRFVFYEGPPTANGLPHPGHCLTRAIKDLFPRYQTMCGRLVERKAGWDTHGLPVEVEVCKQLGIHTKEEIETYGVEKFVRRCIESVFRYTREWEQMTRRLGFWVNLEDAYVTFHQSYVESVWWGLKTLFERDLLYQGHKVVWWWAQGGTALSAGEVGEGYREVDDPSVYVRFPLVGSVGVPPASNAPASIHSTQQRAPVDGQLAQRRRILPHWEAGGSTYFMTFRLRGGELSPSERTLVLNACRHFDAERYLLHAVVVMPDHVHLLWTPLERSPGEWWSIADLMHSIKSFTAKELNAARGTSGVVWQREYFDRIIRNGSDFDEKWKYVVENPARRGLPDTYEWVWVESSSDPAPQDLSTDRRDADAPRAANDSSDNCAGDVRPGTPPHAMLPADAKVSLLVWTTTPWTLISNHFAAVGPDIDYSLVLDKTTGEYLYIATALVATTAAKVQHELEPVATCKGTDLVGRRYIPPFPEAYYQRPVGGKPMGEATSALREPAGGQDYIGWRVTLADFVTLDAGSGLVHEAPAYGEVDFDLLQGERRRFVDDLNGIPLINAVKPDGTFNDEAPAAYRGRWVKDCDREIIRELDQRGILYYQEIYRHEYPFCPRAEDDPLIQYARKSWFVRTSQFKDDFLANNDRINWLPEHIKEGRFGDFLRNNVDWALSRERYWGTPLPIWVCEKTGKMQAIGSLAELMEKPGVTDCTPDYPQGMWATKKAEDSTIPDHLRVHKPYIDAVTYDSPFAKGARMRRVPEVIDCWWDAGSMPFAQWGFPHMTGSVNRFRERFPADFISEAIDQTRGWFYGMLAISTLLFKRDGAGERDVAGVGEAGGGAGVSPATVGEDLQIRYRRKLPHWEAGDNTYFVTFRMRSGELSPPERTIVLDACRHWDEQRCLLHAMVVMPDHVHLLLTPLEKSPGEWWSLSDLLHSIRSFSAHAINKHRGQTGPVWQDDRYDRIVRGERDFEEKLTYIINNPLNRGLGEDYQWLWVEPSESGGNAGGRDARPTQIGPTNTSPTRTGPTRDYPHPYKTCIVLGHVMGEDGLKMSKRTKNYKEPDYIFDHYGADAMRWYFFSGQVPWTSVRFQEAPIRDAQREFLLRLYNIFSFFNIYANIDGFDPAAADLRPAGERSELDRWILSMLHGTIRDVRASLDRFENYPATGRLNEFVDALSNWYVRRSRERFWRGDKDQDKWDAYHTLYECLVTLSKLIAPFTPFFAETMYQNLCRDIRTEEQRRKVARSAAAGAPESVHLCDYPVADEALIDEALAQEMGLVRQVVSLGRAARTGAKLKVRQPLALAEIILVHSEHTEWLAAHSELIAEELNIKAVEFTTEAEQYVTYQVKPNFQTIGPKFGKLAPQIAKALGGIDGADARKTLATTGELSLDVAGQSVRLAVEDLEIRLEARPGWSAAQGRAGVVVVKTELTPELKDEGLVREAIHHVQALRKDANLAYEARIELEIDAPPALRDVLERYADTIRRECLAQRIEFSVSPASQTRTVKIESYEVRLAIVGR